MGSIIGEVYLDPIDRISALQRAKGVPHPLPKPSDRWHSHAPPEMRPYPINAVPNYDITGRRRGKLVAIGLSKDVMKRWVVRCDCGDYEMRTHRAMMNDGYDCCSVCDLERQRNDYQEYLRTGTNKERRL